MQPQLGRSFCGAAGGRDGPVGEKVHKFTVLNVTVWAGLGSILDTVSKDTEDTAPSCILSYLYLRYIFSQLLLMVSVSKYLKDTEDTAPFLSVSVS